MSCYCCWLTVRTMLTTGPEVPTYGIFSSYVFSCKTWVRMNLRENIKSLPDPTTPPDILY